MPGRPSGEAGALAERLYAAYNDHDAAAAAALYAADAFHLEIAQGRRAEGPDAIARGLEGFFAAFPDARWTPDRRIASGGEAAVSYVLSGTLRAPLGPFEPRGQVLELRGVHVIGAGAGRIRWSEDYWDAASFGRQMSAGG